MQSVYIETTIPSYLASLPSKDAKLLEEQKATLTWWDNERLRYRIYTSIFTHDEVSRGDKNASLLRKRYLTNVPLLQVNEVVKDVATEIVQVLNLPQKAVMDASHVAICIFHRMDFMLTWNCTHLANPILQKELNDYCLYHGYFIPIICTPKSLLL